MRTADDLYCAMLASIVRYSYKRQSGDKASPMQQETLEAEPGCTFTLSSPRCNVTGVRSVNLRWAAANVLHFFAATEEAAVLRRYNRLCDKFLTGDKWLGAYGAIAMPQVERCIQLLRASPSSRRAIVTMGELEVQDINRPPCWNLLHFLAGPCGLDLLVYQRSCNLYGVMPYDLVLLTNVLLYVAEKLQVSAGWLRWTFGSLHTMELKTAAGEQGSMVLPYELLSNSAACMRELENPTLKELL